MVSAGFWTHWQLVSEAEWNVFRNERLKKNSCLCHVYYDVVYPDLVLYCTRYLAEFGEEIRMPCPPVKARYDCASVTHGRPLSNRSPVRVVTCSKGIGFTGQYQGEIRHIKGIGRNAFAFMENQCAIGIHRELTAHLQENLRTARWSTCFGVVRSYRGFCISFFILKHWYFTRSCGSLSIDSSFRPMRIGFLLLYLYAGSINGSHEMRDVQMSVLGAWAETVLGMVCMMKNLWCVSTPCRPLKNGFFFNFPVIDHIW